MSKVCVITGGGSGMGLEVAKLLPGYHVIVTGRTVSKLEAAVAEVQAAGVEVEAFACDVSDAASVAALVEHAVAAGPVEVVVHAAGVSPHMTDAQSIWDINAGGTVNVDEQFAAVMDGGVILNVSSMAGYMLPADQTPVQLYQASALGSAALDAGFAQTLAYLPAEQAAGAAYTMSKNFVIWYTKQEAVKYGKKGIRVVSISPGTFTTPMGEVEGEEAAAFALSGAMGRLGDPVEIAKMMVFMVEEATYLDGVDILYDGGVIAATEARAAAAKAAQA